MYKSAQCNLLHSVAEKKGGSVFVKNLRQVVDFNI